MPKLFLLLGALAAFLSVAAGAFGAHGLRGRVDPAGLAVFETAARYQMYHALALLIVAWAATRWPAAGWSIAGWLFVAGLVVFPGTLYLLALGGPRWLGAVTPVGGLCFLAGWIAFAVAALRA